MFAVKTNLGISLFTLVFFSFRALSISNHVNRNNKKIPAQEAEVILQKFKDHKWLADYEIEQKEPGTGKSYKPQRWIKTGIILLSTRFIYEMEPFLKEVYPNLVGNDLMQSTHTAEPRLLHTLIVHKSCLGYF